MKAWVCGALFGALLVVAVQNVANSWAFARLLALYGWAP